MIIESKPRQTKACLVGLPWEEPPYKMRERQPQQGAEESGDVTVSLPGHLSVSVLVLLM